MKHISEVKEEIDRQEKIENMELLETDEVIMEVVEGELILKPRYGGLDLSIKDKPIKSNNIEELKNVIKEQNISARTSRNMILIIEDKGDFFDLKTLATNISRHEDSGNKLEIFRANRLYEITKNEVVLVKDELSKIETDFSTQFMIVAVFCPVLLVFVMFKVAPKFRKKEDEDNIRK